MKRDTLTRRQFLERTSASLAAASVVPRPKASVGNPNALALHGGTPVRSKPFPDWPQTSEVDEQNILQSLRSHRWCTFDGKFIPQFEKAWAEKVGSQGAVLTPCGTHALHMALEILGIGPGDEVIVSPFTYIATIDAILLCYALPVFADSDLKTFQIELGRVLRARQGSNVDEPRDFEGVQDCEGFVPRAVGEPHCVNIEAHKRLTEMRMKTEN